MLEVLVVNASPLIFLGNGGHLDLLRTLGAAKIVVPTIVFKEVTEGPHADRAAQAVKNADWIERSTSPAPPVNVVEWDLGPGESAVIATALANSGSSVVIDDLAGRRCARAVGLKVVGTLGVVIAAHRHGQVADARRVLLDLRGRGMWLSDAVIEHALELANTKR